MWIPSFEASNERTTTFCSDDSLFEEMTHEMNKETSPTSHKSPAPATSTTTTSNGSINNKDNTLLDLARGKADKTDAIAGLLMLSGAVNASIDDEIDNEKLLPVNTLKKLDFAKEFKEKEKCNKQNKSTAKGKDSKLDDTNNTSISSPPKNTRNKGKNIDGKNKHKPEESNSSTPGFPKGILKITRYRLHKSAANTHNPKKWSVLSAAKK